MYIMYTHVLLQVYDLHVVVHVARLTKPFHEHPDMNFTQALFGGQLSNVSVPEPRRARARYLFVLNAL